MNTPYEVHDLVRQMGIKKYHTPLGKLIVLGLLAGVYIAMGGLLATLSASGFSAWAEGNPMLPKLLAGATFPLGLILVVLVGAELFTGNTAYLLPATCSGDIPRSYFWRNWLIIYLCNFAGALAFDYFLAYQTHLFASEDMLSYLHHLAEYKVSQPWGQVFWRGVGANWLVCLAVWLGFASKSMAGRMLGIWFPVMAFVAMGFEHSIANMFYIPTAIFYGAEVSWGAFVADNLIPSTLGNILGGAGFVGCLYAYLYGNQNKKH